MTPPRRRPRFGAAIAYHRLVAVALVLAATLPVAFIAVLVYDQVERSLAADAVARTDRAAAAARVEVANASGELGDLVGSYADWDAFTARVRAGDLDGLRVDVVQFLVDRGTVDGGLLVAPSGRVSAGPPGLVTALQPAGGTEGGTWLATVDGQVYIVAGRPVDLGTASPGRLVLARRLDARFVADVAAFTGFSVAVLPSEGPAALTTDSTITDPAELASRGASGVVRTGDLVVRRMPLADDPGAPELLLASHVSALQSAAGTLPVLVLGLLAVTALAATLLAILLSSVLRRRLRVVHDGLTAVADGRVPPGRVGGDDDDDIARLSAGLNRLVETLDHRETTLRRCLAAATAVPIHVSPTEAARRLAAATVDIFGVAWCRIAAVDGSVLGTATRPGATSPDVAGSRGLPPDHAGAEHEVAEAPLGLGPDGRRLEVGPPASGAWTDADQASLEVMALLTGSVLTETEAYEAAIGRADRLDRLNRVQREFLRSVSHNLRAPLATIELAASDLEEMSTDPFVRTRAEAIRHEERRLARLVTQVLFLSRMETGTLQLDGEPVSLPPLVRRVAAELGIDGRVEIVDRGAGAVAFTDPAATEQITWILLDNAARYAPAGPIRVEVIASGDAWEPVVTLAVEDEGPGVPPQERRRIFQRFVRGSAGRTGDGTGLGLSVARALARSLGGEVAYLPGTIGARFEVRLPGGGPVDPAGPPASGSRAQDAPVSPPPPAAPGPTAQATGSRAPALGSRRASGSGSAARRPPGSTPA